MIEEGSDESDCYSVNDALIEAGMSGEKAKAPLAERQRLATKEDLDELKAATKEDSDALKAGLNELEASFNEHFARIERDLALLKFGYGPVVLALLVKIAFF